MYKKMKKQYIERKNGNLYLVSYLHVDGIPQKKFVYFIGIDYEKV